MLMDSFAIQSLVSELTDLELAVLLALICQEHCLIETPVTNVNDVAGELALVSTDSLSYDWVLSSGWPSELKICEDRFSLSHVILDCSSKTSIDEFSDSILLPDAKHSRSSRSNASYVSLESALVHASDSNAILGFLIISCWRLSWRAKDSQCNHCKKFWSRIFGYPNSGIRGMWSCFSRVYCSLTIEKLIRSKRILTRTSLHITQKTFLFIPVLGFNESTEADIYLNKHLASRVN